MKMRQILIVIILILSPAVHADNSGSAMYVCQGISDAKEKELCISRAEQTISDRNSAITSGASRGISLGWFSLFWPWAWWAFYYGFGLLIGLYLFRDSKSREWVFLGIRPILWLLLAVFNPGITLIAYWLMHYSRFALSYSEAITTINDPTKSE
jgi:hypothetical protein